MEPEKQTPDLEGASVKRKKVVLGRGLGALIPGGLTAPPAVGKNYFLCEIDQISPNRHQPRRRFNEEELAELSQSIQAQGVIQPLIVRKHERGYELIAGERRLRAARMAGLAQVPVVVKDVSDEALLAASLVENIQRADLNPIEESDAYHLLIEGFGLTQEDIAERVGKNRSTVANFLRLRALPEEIRSAVLDGILTMGHAKALMGAPGTAEMLAAFRQIVQKNLTVREAERLVEALKEKNRKPRGQPSSERIYLNDLAERLSRKLGTRVEIRKSGKKGRVVIDFYGDEDLTRLLAAIHPAFQEESL